MSEKNLSESEWKKFSKGRDYKDAALVKAFMALDKAKTPAAELEALADVEKQADALRKAYKADKELGSYLDMADKSLDKQRKAAEKTAKAADEKPDEEEDSPVLLTTKMIPLLRQIRKGEEMPVMMAVAGKDVAVLVSRRAISPARRKLLSDYLDGGTAKFFMGQCIYEENAFTFVMKTQAAGLAKKVRAALLKQVELRLKVRVRGEDPNDIDDDGEAAEDMPEEGKPQAAAAAKPAAAAPAATAPATPAAAPAAEPQAAAAAAAAPGADVLQDQYDARIATLEPRVMALLRAQAGDAGKLRAVAEFVRGKGDAGQYKAAIAGMDSLEKLVVEAEKAAPAAVPAAAATAPAAAAAEAAPKADGTAAATAAFTARLTALMPAIKAAAGPQAETLKARVAEAAGLARKQDFVAASAALDAIDTLIAQPSQLEAAAADPGQQKLDARLAALEERYLALLAQNPADASKLRAVHGFATENAAAGNVAKAVAALDRLDGMMAAAEATLPVHGGSGNAETGYAGLVKYRKTLLDFRAAATKVQGQIDGLKKAIPGALPGEAALADELADALSEFTGELLEAVDDAMNTAENEASPVTAAVAAQLRNYLREVSSNALVKHVDSNPFGVAMSVEKTLTAALEDIRDAMPALA